MVDPKTLKYKNVTISGLPGAGPSTLGLSPSRALGWEYFSGGDFMRRYAVKRGLYDQRKRAHHSAAVYSGKFDRRVDYRQRETLQKKEGKILDSWLSGFMAQGLVKVLKILVFCNKDSLRVDRLVNRDNTSVEEAKKHMFERERDNFSKWSRMYKKEWDEWLPAKTRGARKGNWLNFHHPGLYDLVIDTYAVSKEKSLKLTLDALGYK